MPDGQRDDLAPAPEKSSRGLPNLPTEQLRKDWKSCLLTFLRREDLHVRSLFRLHSILLQIAGPVRCTHKCLGDCRGGRPLTARVPARSTSELCSNVQSCMTGKCRKSIIRTVTISHGIRRWTERRDPPPRSIRTTAKASEKALRTSGSIQRASGTTTSLSKPSTNCFSPNGNDLSPKPCARIPKWSTTAPKPRAARNTARASRPTPTRDDA